MHVLLIFTFTVLSKSKLEIFHRASMNSWKEQGKLYAKNEGVGGTSRGESQKIKMLKDMRVM